MSAWPCRRGVASVVMSTSTMPAVARPYLTPKLPGVELDVLDEPRREDRGPAEEVIEDGDAVALDEDARVVGRGAADDEQAEAEGRARDARQVLHDAQRIAEGAGHARELGLRQRVARHGLRGRRRAHGGLIGGPEALRDDAVDLERRRLADLAGVEIADAGIVRGVGDDHAQRDARLGLEDEAAVIVGDGRERGRRLVGVGAPHDDGHLGVLERVARALLAQAPASDDDRGGRRRRRRGRGRLGRDGLGRRHRRHLGNEVQRELDADRARFPVDLGGRELVLQDGGLRRLVEAVPDGLRDLDLGDVARGVDVDHHRDVRRELRVERLHRVDGLHALEDLGWLREHGRRGRRGGRRLQRRRPVLRAGGVREERGKNERHNHERRDDERREGEPAHASVTSVSRLGLQHGARRQS